MAVAANADSLPLVVVTSLAVKLVLASLSVKVMVAVWVALTLATSDVTATIGATVSTVMVVVTEAVLALPAASVKAPAGTPIVPLVVESAAGVKTTV